MVHRSTDARENAKRNHITNAEFFVGKAEEVLPEFYEKMSGEAQAGSVAAEPCKKDQASDMLHEVKHLRK